VMVLWVTMIGSWGTWLAYHMSIERGKHRRRKRGVWDYGQRKWRRDLEEEYRALTELFWRTERKGGGLWTGARRRSESSLLG
jgi:hypothetical protein